MAKFEKKILFIIFALVLATMSCSTAIWVRAYLCEITGGAWVNMLNDPDGGFCSRKSSDVVEPQMEEAPITQLDQDSESVDLHAPEVESDVTDQEAAAQVDLQHEVPQVEDPDTVPISPTAITYHGTTTIGSFLVDSWGGQIIQDKIVLVIDRDGTVSGSIDTIWHRKSTPIDGCVTDQNYTIIGILSGILNENSNTIQIAFTTDNKFLRSGCPVGNETITDAWTSSAQVQISGNTINGTIEEGFTFEAFKQ